MKKDNINLHPLYFLHVSLFTPFLSFYCTNYSFSSFPSNLPLSFLSPSLKIIPFHHFSLFSFFLPSSLLLEHSFLHLFLFFSFFLLSFFSLPFSVMIIPFYHFPLSSPSYFTFYFFTGCTRILREYIGFSACKSAKCKSTP